MDTFPNAGTIVLGSGTACAVTSTPGGHQPNDRLNGGMVTARDLVNLRDTPDNSGVVLGMTPYDADRV